MFSNMQSPRWDFLYTAPTPALCHYLHLSTSFLSLVPCFFLSFSSLLPAAIADLH